MKTPKSTSFSDVEITQAEEKLGFKFSAEYIAFIKSGYDIGTSILQGLEIRSEFKHLDIYRVRADARQHYGLPEQLLPICEDNADYYCLNAKGEVVFWSHDGAVDEKWENVKIWIEAMIVEDSSHNS